MDKLPYVLAAVAALLVVAGLVRRSPYRDPVMVAAAAFALGLVLLLPDRHESVGDIVFSALASGFMAFVAWMFLYMGREFWRLNPRKLEASARLIEPTRFVRSARR